MARFNVLQPELIWIGDQCFRKFPSRQEKSKNEENENSYRQCATEVYDDDDLDNIAISRTDNMFTAVEQIPTLLYSEVQGKLKSIPKKMGTVRITFPNVKKQDFVELTISSRNEREVREAYRRIRVVLEAHRLKAGFSHFVSFPMNFRNLKASFNDFKREVLENCADARGVSSSIFQNPDKLHMTIVMLLMFNNQEEEKAAEVLQNCRKDIGHILRDEKLTVRVKGIEFMNDDDSAVDVLYAKIDEANNDCLQRISDLLLKNFNTSKLSASDDWDQVKLHITLMNSLFRRNDQEEEAQSPKARESFDARPIMEKYRDFDFGSVTLTEVHISVRNSKQENGYYASSTVLSLSNK